MQHYKPKGGYHRYHFERSADFKPISTRHLVFMTYLNTVTDKGGTEFYHQEMTTNAIEGNTVIWSSDWTHTHRGVPSPTQDKYIITGVYGSQRILNGKPRRPHYGVDFHAPEGTDVKAMMDGTITLAEKNMYFTGGTIIFDHGHGISTLYMHMKDIYVKIGQSVKQGEVVGTLGKTGRATGPHLDIRLNWFDVKLDPMTILK